MAIWPDPDKRSYCMGCCIKFNIHRVLRIGIGPRGCLAERPLKHEISEG